MVLLCSTSSFKSCLVLVFSIFSNKYRCNCWRPSPQESSPVYLNHHFISPLRLVTRVNKHRTINGHVSGPVQRTPPPGRYSCDSSTFCEYTDTFIGIFVCPPCYPTTFFTIRPHSAVVTAMRRTDAHRQKQLTQHSLLPPHRKVGDHAAGALRRTILS